MEIINIAVGLKIGENYYVIGNIEPFFRDRHSALLGHKRKNPVVHGEWRHGVL